MGEPIVEGSLTGHRRYRRHEMIPYCEGDWSFLVLQVCTSHWDGKQWQPVWRDATPEDVTGAELYTP